MAGGGGGGVRGVEVDLNPPPWKEWTNQRPATPITLTTKETIKEKRLGENAVLCHIFQRPTFSFRVL